MSESGRYDWVIVDGIGPFFYGYKKKRINWSKIPLAALPIEGKRLIIIGRLCGGR